MRHQFRAFENDKSIIERIPFVSFRETAGDHARDPFELQCGGGLFAARASSKIKSCDNDVPRLIELVEFWIVIFKCHRCHLLWYHVISISVFASVNAVGVQIVFVDEQNSAA